MQANAPSIISTDDLNAILGNANLRILDCSVSMGRQPGDDQRINFLKSHIKGACFLDLDYLKDMKNDLPFMMPNEKHFIDTMKRHDVKLTDQVVCYDTGAMQFFGYRAAWMLQAMGHPNVQVLDGGFAKWTKEGKAVEATDANANEDAFGYKLNADKIKLYDQMKAFEDNEAERTYQLLDVRAPDMYNNGSIKGAKNFPVGKLLTETKELKSADERRKLCEDAGVDLEKDITLSCQGGIAATVAFASLKDIAKGKLSMYDGSWSEFNSKK